MIKCAICLHSRIRFKLVALMCIILVNVACTTVNSKVGGFFNLDTDFQLALKVDADINPDDNKTPSPLFIRMYELKSPKMFKKANFIDLFERDSEALGADMVAKQKLKRIKPGEGREESFVLSAETKYVGLYAEFLQYKNSAYKVIIPVAPNNVVSTTATVQLSGNRLSILK